jgi:GNAT superfamily N-acetyltransferase
MTKIVFEQGPSPKAHEAIVNGLVQYNDSKTEGLYAPPFFSCVLSVRDDADEPIGGLTAKITYGWMYIELLFLPEALRGTGIGAQLMVKAEEIAREKGCVGIRVDTMGFQAPEFYPKFGYTAYGQLQDCPPGHTRYFFSKRLD